VGDFIQDKNIRDIVGLDDGELRASMRKSGWLEQLPAYADENGVLVIGHRRMKIAKELKIEPVVKTITFGNGSDADAKRLELAIASNIGAAGLSKKERERVATLAYQHGYTQEQISKLLGVSQKTVSKDLNYTKGINSTRAKTASNPKGAGRPKGTKEKSVKQRKGRGTPVLERARDIVRPLIMNGQPAPSRKLDKEHGISHVHIETAIAVEKALLAERPVDASTLSMSAQEKLDAAIRQAKRKLEAEFTERVRQQTLEDIRKTWLPDYQQKYAEYRAVIERRTGIMSAAEYKSMLACLHPDRVQDPELKKKYENAFNLLTKYKLKLLDESQAPTSRHKLPETWAEWEALREKATAERRAARAGRQQANVSR
jgi:ParB-like chromosome segregation protein Spo0J